MGLFLCVFADEASLLVDVADDAAARVAAREEVKAEPTHVRPVLVPLGFRVYFEPVDGDPDSEEMTIDPLPHVIDVLGAIEDECDAETMCTSEADGEDGAVLRCELAAHDEKTKHRSGRQVWT